MVKPWSIEGKVRAFSQAVDAARLAAAKEGVSSEKIIETLEQHAWQEGRLKISADSFARMR